MALAVTSEHCLNCGAALQGAFCSQCGQRALAPYPTVREMVDDAWQELSGWDGRFVRTFRILLGRPGQLTIDTLATPNLGGPRTAVLPRK